MQRGKQVSIIEDSAIICTLDINGDCGVTVYKGVNNTGVLRWTDYVANEWCEEFPTVAHAFARLSMLYVCADSNWEKGFANNPEKFTEILDTFIQSQVG